MLKKVVRARKRMMLKNNVKPKNTRIRIKNGQMVEETGATIEGDVSLPNLGNT